MKRLGLTLLLLNLGLWLWQNPGLLRGPIAPEEARAYLAVVEGLPLPADERAGMLDGVRRFMAEDDGQPLYMLNLMRYFPELRPLPGVETRAMATPRQSNAYYEEQVMPLLFAVGGYPAYAGAVSARNLLATEAALNDWHRLLLVRYPSRRAFMQLMTNPAYAPLAPYKLMALQVVLAPTAAEIVLPPLTSLSLGLSLLLFLGLGWWRSARRRAGR